MTYFPNLIDDALPSLRLHFNLDGSALEPLRR
jgi:hypothetical protein